MRTLPAIHALHLTELVARWGVHPSALLRGSGLQRAELQRPGATLPVPTMVALVERARALTREPALGIYFGLQMRISWHGYLGLAAMASQNVREALELATRFLPTLTGAIALDLDVAGRTASLEIHERADFGPARDAIVLAIIVGIWQLGCTLTGRQLDGAVDVAMGEPPYFARFRAMTPSAIRFDRPAHRFVFARETLDLPFPTADPVALALTREQCERELDALGFAGPLVARVAALALRAGGGVRTLDEVAAQLQMSSRTLKRRLAESGTTYSALLDGERERRALALLETTSLTIDEIAERLGYHDVANFGRAFRRWTGRTPAATRAATRARRRGPQRPRRSR
jgi:AraC-like DNA-binding protein